MKTIILMMMNPHIMNAQSADVHTMKLIMAIKPAQNAGGMPKKKPGVKPEPEQADYEMGDADILTGRWL